jgi:hypothetical protein
MYGLGQTGQTLSAKTDNESLENGGKNKTLGNNSKAQW